MAKETKHFQTLPHLGAYKVDRFSSVAVVVLTRQQLPRHHTTYIFFTNERPLSKEGITYSAFKFKDFLLVINDSKGK